MTPRPGKRRLTWTTTSRRGAATTNDLAPSRIGRSDTGRLRVVRSSGTRRKKGAPPAMHAAAVATHAQDNSPLTLSLTYPSPSLLNRRPPPCLRLSPCLSVDGRRAQPAAMQTYTYGLHVQHALMRMCTSCACACRCTKFHGLTWTWTWTCRVWTRHGVMHPHFMPSIA